MEISADTYSFPFEGFKNVSFLARVPITLRYSECPQSAPGVDLRSRPQPVIHNNVGRRSAASPDQTFVHPVAF